MLIGFAVGIFGHLTGLRWLVAAGIALIFLGAFLFPLALNLTKARRRSWNALRTAEERPSSLTIPQPRSNAQEAPP